MYVYMHVYMDEEHNGNENDHNQNDMFVMKRMIIKMLLLHDAADLTTIIIGFNTYLYNKRNNVDICVYINEEHNGNENDDNQNGVAGCYIFMTITILDV